MQKITKTTYGDVEYRMEGNGQSVVLVLNGGHCSNCNSPIPFLPFLMKQGFQVLIPSRPGYGNTPSSSGKTAELFAETIINLMDSLQIEKVIVMAVSASGRTALQLAGKYPERVDKLVLQCALTHDGWPTLIERALAYLLFNPIVEKAFWFLFRQFIARYPLGTLKIMMKSFSNLPVNQLIEKMSDEQIKEAIQYLSHLQSGSGFWHDIHHQSGDVSRIKAPTLIIHSQYDGSNPLSHAEYADRHISNSELFITEAESHLIWFSEHNKQVEQKMIEFLR